MDGAVVSCYPEVPISQFNHAADIDVNEKEAEDLLEKATRHFVSKGSSDVRFRTTALTRPRSFRTFLRNHGFVHSLGDEESAMVFKGKDLEDKLNPKVKVKEISESEDDEYGKLVLTIFEMPFGGKRALTHTLFKPCEKEQNVTWLMLERSPLESVACFLFGRLEEYSTWER